MQISLNVYDVTNTPNENTNGMICRLNSITRELNLGGVFHGAVQIDNLEWSFGYCESGTGVYCCHARSNSLYTFREHIELGTTRKTRQEIKEILSRFKRTWPGTSYDLLQRNCCHFCEELCAVLDVSRPPAWLNRFAQGADATVKFTNEASALARRVSSNLSVTAQQSANWLRDLSQRVMAQVSVAGSASGDDEDDPAALSASSAAAASENCSRRRESNLGPHAGGGGTHSVEASSRSEPPGVGGGAGVAGRLTNKLRMLAGGVANGGGSGSGNGGGSGSGAGLPASTHASTSDLESLEGPAHPGAQQQQQQGGGAGLSASQALSALRQKWHELEATAGDGTKQFLFGLIKTRQARLDEDDPELFGPAPGGAEDPLPASLGSGPVSSSTAAVSQPGAGAGGEPGPRAVSPPPTEAPPSQVIVHPLLPLDWGAAGCGEPRSKDGTAAAEPPQPQPQSAASPAPPQRQQEPSQLLLVPDMDGTAAGAATAVPPAAAAAAPALGSRHLLDM